MIAKNNDPLIISSNIFISIIYETDPPINSPNQIITSMYPRGPALPPKSANGQNGPVRIASIIYMIPAAINIFFNL